MHVIGEEAGVTRSDLVYAEIRQAIVQLTLTAALRVDAADIAFLRETVAGQARTPREDHIAFVRHDEAFHEAIARIAGTSRAWRVLEGLKAQLDRVRFLAIDEITSSDAIIQEHHTIIDALEARSPQQAEDAMRAHMAEILVSLPKLAAAHSELFAS